MFDIGATELLLIAVVAILVIGPKDMPLALRTAGRWVGKMRKMSAHFRAGVDNIVREAELEDMEKKWKEQNERIMREHPEGVPAESRAEMEPTGAYPAAKQASVEKPADVPSAERAAELKVIAEKQKAAAEAAEQAAMDAEAEAEALATTDADASPPADKAKET